MRMSSSLGQFFTTATNLYSLTEVSGRKVVESSSEQSDVENRGDVRDSSYRDRRISEWSGIEAHETEISFELVTRCVAIHWWLSVSGERVTLTTIPSLKFTSLLEVRAIIESELEVVLWQPDRKMRKMENPINSIGMRLLHMLNLHISKIEIKLDNQWKHHLFICDFLSKW